MSVRPERKRYLPPFGEAIAFQIVLGRIPKALTAAEG
jgi:hypothetical protein